MTNGEKSLLIAYLVDAGEIDSDGDQEAQFMDWHRCREDTVSGEVHYRAILGAARVRKRSFDEGWKAGFAEAAAKLGWEHGEAIEGIHRFTEHDRQAEN